MNGQTIYVLHIHHRHGDDLYTYLTKEEAEASIANYGAYWWDEEIENPKLLGKGADPEAVKDYFVRMADTEWYVVEETTLGLSA